jgi:hypothetical protein
MIVMGSEFGRTPDINENDGRDHYPLAYSTVFAGGGVKGGFVYGSTDKEGRRVADKQVTPQDFRPPSVTPWAFLWTKWSCPPRTARSRSATRVCRSPTSSRNLQEVSLSSSEAPGRKAGCFFMPFFRR